ncbi:MAG TPA: ATP-binding protein [Reyranella sp.]|nr:ATP-binding protein [Reyranella sp.]
MNSIDAAYLIGLPSHGPSESRRVEYKSQFRDDKKNGLDRDTFRKDVSAFANTEGGDLVIGVVEKGGSPVSVLGVELADGLSAHQTKEMLDQVLLDLQPRLTGYQIIHQEVSAGRHVFLVRVPQSFRAPHSIGSGKGFYYRTNSGRDPMNVDQVREAFLNSAGLESQLEAFRNKRVSLIESAPPLPLAGGGPLVVLHVLPVVGASRRVVVDVIRDKDVLLGDDPPGFRNAFAAMNFDGCYMAIGSISRPPFLGYAQWFRNGFREIVWVRRSPPYQGGTDEDRLLFEEDLFARHVVAAVDQSVKQLRALDVPYPFYVAVSVVKCKDYVLGFSRPEGAGVVMHRQGGLKSPQDRYDLLECLVESEATNIPAVLKPSFDQFAQAFGFADSINYDAKGCWKHGSGASPRR